MSDKWTCEGGARTMKCEVCKLEYTDWENANNIHLCIGQDMTEIYKLPPEEYAKWAAEFAVDIPWLKEHGR